MDGEVFGRKYATGPVVALSADIASFRAHELHNVLAGCELLRPKDWPGGERGKTNTKQITGSTIVFK